MMAGTPLMQTPILHGLRVVEASAFVAAPLGGMTLAQLGAEVIRIDPLGGGLDQHRWPVTPDGLSLFWCGLNKHKRSVTLDLAQPEGRELAQAIATAPGEDAGIVLSNLPARGWLDPLALRARRADLIQLTLLGDRHGGSAVDYTVNPKLGFPYLTGHATEDAGYAVNHVLPAWDLATGHLAAVGILAAERHRRRTAQGQQVTLALQDVALAVMGHLGFIAEAEAGAPRQPVGNDLYGAFGRDFATADGQRVMVVGLTGRQWRALVDALALQPAVAAIEATARAAGQALDLSREGDRFRARHALAEAVAPWIAARPLAQVAAQLDRHGVCWQRYQTVAQLVADDPDCSTDNPLFARVHQPGVGEGLVPAQPLQFSAVPRVPPQPAPRLGEHTEAVLAELAGVDAAQFGRLVDRGVVAAPGA